MVTPFKQNEDLNVFGEKWASKLKSVNKDKLKDKQPLKEDKSFYKPRGGRIGGRIHKVTTSSRKSSSSNEKITFIAKKKGRKSKKELANGNLQDVERTTNKSSILNSMSDIESQHSKSEPSDDGWKNNSNIQKVSKVEPFSIFKIEYKFQNPNLSDFELEKVSFYLKLAS